MTDRRLSLEAGNRFAKAVGQLRELGYPRSTASQLAAPAANDEPGSLLIYTLNRRGDQHAEFVSDPFDLEAARWCGRHNIEIRL